MLKIWVMSFFKDGLLEKSTFEKESIINCVYSYLWILPQLGFNWNRKIGWWMHIGGWLGYCRLFTS